MLKPIIVASTLLNIIACVIAQVLQSPANLDQYEWGNRIVLIFAPSDSTTMYQEQIAEFQNSVAGFKERELITFHLFPRVLPF